MRNKKLERKIALLNEFIDEWIRFRDFLKGALKDGKVSAEEERKFMEIKSLIARKYQGLGQTLGEEFSPDNRITEIISQAVSLEGLAGTSGMKFGKIENDWHQSYIRLNEFLGGLESQRDEIAKISRMSLFFGGLSKMGRGLIRGVIKLILILVILFIMCLVGSYYFLADEEAKEEGLVNYLTTTVKDWIGVADEEPEQAE
ncbi:hypothetical protein LR007_01405 [candidate division NPL-UPA2 bacterium]|nr:hypothetical protein [candidate division NPL-UPA2 bacterium]